MVGGCNDSLRPYESQDLKGKTLYCGESFSIAIPIAEKFVIEPGTPEDFILYQWDRPSGRITIYEGNFPEPGGIVFKARMLDWPNVVSFHGPKDAAKTLQIFKARPPNCREPARLELTP
jgi:hypothetical protein